MKGTEDTSQIERYIALDIHKEYVLAGGQTAAQFARERLDALGMGQELTSIPWGSKKPIPLPPSKLKGRSDVPNK